MNSAIPVCWSNWLAKGINDEPESGGGLMIGAIQLSIMMGGALGGLLLDHISVAATFMGGSVLLIFASLAVGTGRRIQPSRSIHHPTRSGLGELYGEPELCCDSAD